MQHLDYDGDLSILPTTTDDLIFGYLSPSDLISHSRTCKVIRNAVSSFHRRAFRIETTLRKFFTQSEVVRFRELQEVTGLIISGSVALEFFERTEYANSDLDLYVDDRFRRPVAIWLKSIGYKFLPRPAFGPKDLDAALNYELDEDETSPSIVGPMRNRYPKAILVLDFIKSNPHSRIQLITSSATPLEMVLRFHSTCVMNLITYDKAYSIFPRATFGERRSLIFVQDEDLAAMARAKYEQRGWSFIEAYQVPTNDPLSSFAKGSRHLGDSKCWSITLHPERDHLASTWESNSWKLEYENNQTPKNVWILLKNPMLHWTYLLCPTWMLRAEHAFKAVEDKYSLLSFSDSEKDMDKIFNAELKEYLK